jgi:Tfp pilus assembly protein PilF
MRTSSLFLLLIICGCSAREQDSAPASDAQREAVRNFWSLYRKANQLRVEEDHEGAAQAYKDALRLNPRHEDSLYYLAASLDRTGDWNGATDALQQLVDLNPSSSRAISQLGYMLSTPGPGALIDFDRAQRLFERSKELNKEQAGPFLQFGHLHLNRGALHEAAQSFLIAARFGAPEGNLWAGYTSYLQGRSMEAARLLQNVLALWERERHMATAGVRAEGDVRPANKPATALEKSGLKARYLLSYMNPAPRDPSRWMPLDGSIHPKGKAAWGRFDGDDLPDLIVGGEGPVTLYRNQDGTRFVDVTSDAGLDRIRNVSEAVWGDVDRDGLQDLYLIGARTFLLRNVGGRHFADITAASGLAGARATTRAFLLDYDGDGLLDVLEIGSAIRLYRNGGTKWVEQTASAGLVSSGAAVGAAAADYNGDGRVDLFLLNWRKPARLYLNRGDGTFLDSTDSAGLSSICGENTDSLFFDFNGDGRLDLFVAAHGPLEDVASGITSAIHTPRLFRNAGDGRFVEVTTIACLRRAYGSMQAHAADFDSDGWLDLLLVNGSPDGQRVERSTILRNVNGADFVKWLELPPGDGPVNLLGAAVADFNRDGAPDIYLAPNRLVMQRGRLAGLFMNQPSRALN